MTKSNSAEPVRPLAHEWTADGCIRWRTVLSPEVLKVRGSIMKLPSQLIPIIFLPGIMGSNLRMKEQKSGKSGKSVWTPPNGKWQGIKEGLGRGAQPSTDRQRELNPDNTEVNDGGVIDIPSAMDALIPPADARRRGWGTVHWESYGEFLMQLDLQLNFPFGTPTQSCGAPLSLNPIWKDVMRIPQRAKDDGWCAKAPDMKCDEDDLRKLVRNYFMPVHAIGYNWLQSNGESAEKVATEITKIKNFYEQNGQFKCRGMIVVTHSMGGLVARRLQQLPEMEKLILGVVHGVQPVHGAAAVYRRLQAGTEGKSFFADGPLAKLAGGIGAVILGNTARDTTPVLAQSPGPLELLPNQFYNGGKPWLFVETQAKIDEPNAKPGTASARFEKQKLLALPQTDPYEEIYGQRDAWYRLVDEAYLDPKGEHEQQQAMTGLAPSQEEVEQRRRRQKSRKDTAWKSYIDTLDTAKEFHETVTTEGAEFHPCTYAYFGDDPKQRSFATVTWRGERVTKGLLDEAAVRQGRRVGNDASGNMSVDFTPAGNKQKTVAYDLFDNSSVRMTISDQDSGGDGTVPTCSGEAVEGYAKLRATFRMKGFNHQMSYAHPDTRLVTLYSVLAIAKEKAFDNAK